MLKKTTFFIIILIFSLILTGCDFRKEEEATGDATLIDSTNQFKISVPEKFKFEEHVRAGTRSLSKYSKTEAIYIYGETVDKSKIGDYLEHTKIDRNSILDSNKGYDATEVVEQKIKNYTAYTYSYKYTYDKVEPAEEFYYKVMWIYTEKQAYILDIEVSMKNYEEHKEKIGEMFESFEEI